MSPMIPLIVMDMVLISVAIPIVSASKLLMTRMVGIVMNKTFTIMRLAVIITTITIPPLLVFVIMIVLERIVFQLRLVRVHMMVLHFFHLKKKRTITSICSPI
jgi:hypothetical protein